MRITIEGLEAIEKTVKPQGNGAMALVPKQWVGKQVQIILLDTCSNHENKIPYLAQEINFIDGKNYKLGDPINNTNIETILVNENKDRIEIKLMINDLKTLFIPLKDREVEITKVYSN
jgi:putative transposon-encoded protein